MISPQAREYSNIVAEMAANNTPFVAWPEEVAFRTWFDAGWLACGCTPNYLVLKQPNTALAITLIISTYSIGENVTIWWGDGRSDTYISPSMQTCTHNYATPANRSVVVLGRLQSFNSSSPCGGRVSTAKSLQSLSLLDGNITKGSISPLSLALFSSSNDNTITGHAAMVANSPGLYSLEVYGLTVVSSADVNSILTSIYLYRNNPKADTIRLCDLRGNCEAPTGQGIIDKAALISAGWAVYTN